MSHSPSLQAFNLCFHYYSHCYLCIPYPSLYLLWSPFTPVSSQLQGSYPPPPSSSLYSPFVLHSSNGCVCVCLYECVFVGPAIPSVCSFCIPPGSTGYIHSMALSSPSSSNFYFLVRQSARVPGLFVDSRKGGVQAPGLAGKRSKCCEQWRWRGMVTTLPSMKS